MQDNRSRSFVTESMMTDAGQPARRRSVGSCHRAARRYGWLGLACALAVGLLAACGSGADSGSDATDAGATDTGATGTEETAADSSQHAQICEQINATVGLNDGYDVPGVAGAPRWGMPSSSPSSPLASRRVRRSWSSLDEAEKKHVVDGFVALKNVTVDSGDPGSPRAEYSSFCTALGLEPYARNLYDFYVEAHANAFVSMMTSYQDHTRMAHMAPQFVVWHRYLLLRIEADIAEALGDPTFALPYWDWTDCYADGNPDTCDLIFEQGSLGSAGSCEEGDQSVAGYLTERGFATNIYTNGESSFSPDSIVCGQRPIRRAVGCSEYVEGPPDAAAIAGIFDRTVYDEAPYNSCDTDATVSFRQYLEGFTNDETRPYCVATGCFMHGRGHGYVGGDMDGSSASPNDPIFFLHHAQVDRLWAAWQEANLAAGDEERHANFGNPGFPDDYAGPLFNFTEVQASELLDYKSLGYEYDTLPSAK
jgi:tyrosinase